MDSHDKKVKILEEFLKDYTMEGACGFWVQPDEEGGEPSVYIVLDLDWIQSIQTKPDFVARRMRQGLKEDIKNWTGIDVPYVGSTAKKCDNLKEIKESLSPSVRRRLSFDGYKESLDILMEYTLNPCSFDSVGNFIGEVCDIMVYNLVEDLGEEVSPRDKDKLYYYFVDTFGEYIAKYYNKHCVKGLKESKKRIIVTESQYNRLFEQKKTKVEMFQELINDKLEDIKKQCNELSSDTFTNEVGFDTCHEVEVVDSIIVDEVEMMTGARTDMYGNMYDSTPSVYVKITVNYSNIRDINDFDNLTYDLKWMLKKSTGGLPVVFDYRVKNLNTNKDW
jgi:hypothetical protein